MRQACDVESAKTDSGAGVAFVTGGTGFVGSFLIESLLRRGWRVVALVRGPQAEARLRHALGTEFLPASVRIVEGDVRAEHLGLGEAEWDNGAGCDEVWHCAASFEARPDGREELTDVNVNGTRRVLELAARARQGRGAAIWHVSTAFAAPAVNGLARELPAPPEAPCRNDYERSKREAERLVLAAVRSGGLHGQIFRPSIIVGDSRTGRAAGFAAYYDIVRALRRFGHNGETLRLQTRPELTLNMVPVDFVVEAMWLLSRAVAEPGGIFHIVNDVPVSLAELHAGIARMPGLAQGELVDAAAFRDNPRTSHERAFERMTHFEAVYLGAETRFDSTQFRRVVPVDRLPCPAIDAALLERINHAFLDTADLMEEVRR